MNDTEFEEALKKSVQVCIGDDNDLIQRGDALNAIWEVCRIGCLPSSALTRKEQREVVLFDALQAVRTVKATVPAQGWISVDDHPPEENGEYLCWYEYFRYGDYNCMYQTCDRGHYVNGRWGGEPMNGDKCKVLAWMPLPAPFAPEAEP